MARNKVLAVTVAVALSLLWVWAATEAASSDELKFVGFPSIIAATGEEVQLEGWLEFNEKEHSWASNIRLWVTGHEGRIEPLSIAGPLYDGERAPITVYLAGVPGVATLHAEDVRCPYGIWTIQLIEIPVELYFPLVYKNYPPPTPTPTPTSTPTPTRTPEPTSTPTPTPTSTPRPTKTPQPPPPVTCEELICNGGFEWCGCWDIPTSVARQATYTALVFRTGSLSMRLGITHLSDARSYSSVSQQVTIPGDAVSATLSFWYYPICQDALPYDWQGAIIYDHAWGFLAWAMPKVCSNSQSWTHHTFDLTPYKGQTIILYFNVYNDGVGNLKTAMYLDDVSIQVCH